MREREGLFKSGVTFDNRRLRPRAWLLIYPNNTRIFSFHRFTNYSRRTEKLDERMHEMASTHNIVLLSPPALPRVVSNRKRVGSPAARVLVVIPIPYQYQAFSVYPSCTHQTDYGAIARVKRSSLSEKSTAVRQQWMVETA